MELAATSYPKVFYHSLKQVKNNHDAADITQNTFIKALMHFSKIRDPASLEPWLFTICNNEIKQFFRNAKKTSMIQENEFQAVESPTPYKDEDYDILYSAIDNLSYVQRQVILLKYFGGYTMHELAIILAVNLSTVKSRLYEARKTLKRLLDTQAITPSLQKERRDALMATLNLCEIGAVTIPCMSLHAQKQLVQCAKDNTKLSTAILSELANIPTGQAFMEACNGKLSYEELLRILACCDDSLLYRIGGLSFQTWRNAIGNPLVKDVTALYKTGGYIDSVEPIIYVKSIRDTCIWYKKYLNWDDGGASDDNDCERGHAIICPYTPEGTHNNYGHFKGFHLRCGGSGDITNAGLFVFVSGLEGLRTDIADKGWGKISDIFDGGWGTRSFRLTDLNGLVIEFCEWM